MKALGTIVIRLKKDFLRNREIYLLLLPVIAFYAIFHYKPMYGAIIAFKDYSPVRGILGSQFVGFKHFKGFFESYYFWRVFKNTLMISINSLIFSFPAPIILALMIDELKGKRFKKTVQTISYMPHFISMVVICGLIKTFTMDDGAITQLLSYVGIDTGTMLNKSELFVPIYVVSNIWQGVGWGSIVYIAALSGIDVSLYEASELDGAGRLKQIWHVTLPSIMPTIVILLILSIGQIMKVGYEKILLLYHPGIYDTADVISTFVYRRGIQELNWSFGSAVGIFNSVINFTLLIIANYISKRVNETSLW